MFKSHLCLVRWEVWACLAQGCYHPSCFCASSIRAMSLFRKRTSGTAVSYHNPKTVHPAVPRWVPGGLGGFPMGRLCAAQSLLRGWTASLQLCNGLSEIGNDFCLLLICHDQLVNCIVLLDGCICQVVQQSSNAAIFSAWTISCAAAWLAKAKLLEVMRLMSRISANAAVQWSFQLFHLWLRRGWHLYSCNASIMFPLFRACLVPVITIISLEMGTPASCAKVWHFSCLRI